MPRLIKKNHIKEPIVLHKYHKPVSVTGKQNTVAIRVVGVFVAISG